MDAGFPGSPASQGQPWRCEPDSAENYLKYRCSNTNIPAVDSWGGQEWVRVECRDSTRYLQLNDPVYPLDATIANRNGVYDINFNATVNAESYPTGSYAQSCFDCSLSQDVFSCSCRNIEGNSIRSSIDLNACVSSELTNNNGSLQCIAAENPPAEETPPVEETPAEPGHWSETQAPMGSYLQSCSGCQTANSVLQCGCLDMQGQTRSTSLVLGSCSENNIYNSDGLLGCSTNQPVSDDYPVPQGSYQQSCQSCSVSGSMFQCQCRNIQGQMVNTVIDLQSCGAGYELSNINGQLTCN